MRLFLIILSFASNILYAQQANVLQPTLRVEGHFADIAIDPLGQLYLISEEGQLKKINEAGETIGQYNETRRNGKLQSIDLSNPLRPLLFFKDLSTLVVLDRNLNKRDKIEFRSLGMVQVSAVAAAYDNGYWVYDAQDASIKKISEQQRQVERVVDLRQQLAVIPNFKWMTDQGPWLIALDEAEGFYIFDHYGAFRKKVPFQHFQDITIIYPWCIGRRNNQLVRLNIETMEENSFPLPTALQGASKMVMGQYHLAAIVREAAVRYTFKINRTDK